MVPGIIFVGIQTIHPPDILSSVTTARWAIVHYLGIAMALLGLLGIAGLYARQMEEAGWLGLAGFLLFSLFFTLTRVPVHNRFPNYRSKRQNRNDRNSKT